MALTEFDQDVIDRKRLARQAKYRKNGSKSRRCPMSTDHMTPKQWRERNGKIVEIKMNEPVSWETFQALSKATREEYIHRLQETYNINASSLAEMFGVCAATVRRYIEREELNVEFAPGRSMNKERRAAWETFLGCGGEQRLVCQDQAEEFQGERTLPGPPPSRSEQRISMTGFSLSFSGALDANEIVRQLGRFFRDGDCGEIEIVCKFGKSG